MPCNNCVYSIREFVNLLSDRRRVVDFLVEHGVLNRNSQCNTCGSRLDININTLLYTCSKKYRIRKKVKKCTTKKNGRKGTWFSKSRLSIEDVLYFTVLWLRLPYPRQKFIMRELKCCDRTVVDWSSYCREVCVQWSLDHSQRLGGPGKIVEIDEAKFGKRKYNRGRRIEGQWVFGGFERDSKKIFLVPVPDRSAQTLLQVIQEWILPDTTIVSDCWKSYDTLNDEGFQHFAINHSINYVDPNDATIHTQNIERTWRDIRGGIPRYGRKDAHFVGYLAEFLFKRSITDDGDIHRFFFEISRLYPPNP